MNSKPIDSPMDPNSKLLSSQGEPLVDPEKCKRLVGKLNISQLHVLTFTLSSVW